VAHQPQRHSSSFSYWDQDVLGSVYTAMILSEDAPLIRQRLTVSDPYCRSNKIASYYASAIRSTIKAE